MQITKFLRPPSYIWITGPTRSSKTMVRSVLRALAVLCMVLPACDQGKNRTAAKSSKLTIAVIPKATTHSYWKAAQAGAEKAAQEFDLTLEWQGPLDDSRIADQITIFNNLAASGVSGILLAPCDDKALGHHVRNATKRGLPIAIFDSPCAGIQGTDYINFVATDNKKAGASAANTLSALIDQPSEYRKDVLMIRFTEGSASTRLREEGFLEAITSGGKLQVIEQQFTDGSMAGAQRVAETLLNNYVRNNKLELGGVFASNQPTAEGTYNALRALKDKGVEIPAKFVGFDDSDLLKQGLSNGIIQALVVQDPEKMGYLGVKSVVDHLAGRPVGSYVDTGVTVKFADNSSH